MRKTQKIIALALGSVMSFALFAGCGGTKGDPYVASALSARICYDNLNAGYVEEADTQYTLELKKEVSDIVVTAKDAEGKDVSDPSSVAVFDEATGVLTAKGAGTVTLSLQDGSGKELSSVQVEVAPAYAIDPENQYNLSSSADYGTATSKYAGWCHDPSLIEVEEDGQSVYYIFSTGWDQGNEIRRSTDMIHWEYIGKTFSADTEKYMMLNDGVGDWLTNDGAVNYSYLGQTAQPGAITVNTRPSWWAPDIVPAADGGYWLYTCVVDGGADAASGGSGVPVQSEEEGMSGNYTRACIILCYADTLEAEAFDYVGVLMQSSIPFSGAAEDVNAIDPQIIYTDDGKMYMAYGSFGTGDYMLELDPKTGLRKDGKNEWYTHEQIRRWVSDVTALYSSYEDENGLQVGWTHEYYGKNISYNDMEAPVIARHDNVTVSDENGIRKDENGKEMTGLTFYYSMHSYDALAATYSMWGGRSTSVTGPYLSTNGNRVANNGIGKNNTTGNKYMGSFAWADKVSTCIDIIAPGHNDLFTMSNGTNIAAYIVRTTSFAGGNTVFLTQTHQYYLNSLGDIVINPNRYGGEIDRSVSKEELLHFTQDNKFKMVMLYNGASAMASNNTSIYVTLTEDGKIADEAGVELGTWQMYGDGYVKFNFTNTSAHIEISRSKETVFYGVVRPAWLDDQNKSGFTITCMGQTNGMAMFMNNVSTISL